MKKILVFRLSSLGDLILATSFLETLPAGIKVDWVVSSSFEFALAGHPRIERLIAFDKKTGFAGWKALLRTLTKETYGARIDLHRNLRTRFALWYLRYDDLEQSRFIAHFSVSKERFRTLILFLLKRLTPRFLLPTPYWQRFAEVALQCTQASPGDFAKPSYLPLLANLRPSADSIFHKYQVEPKKYFCVMPAASYSTKEWPIENYLPIIRSTPLVPIVLGRKTDHASVALCQLLLKTGVPFRDALSEPDFKITAFLLQNAAFYFGCDTGLAHLSESVGTKANIIFGPTRPAIGFGPHLSMSREISLTLNCAPCSKDGQVCIRVTDPYACLKKLTSAHAEACGDFRA